MMNFLLTFILGLFLTGSSRPVNELRCTALSPLNQFSTVWNEPKYDAANSACTVTYMSAAEKEVINIINLAWMDPSLFESTVISQYPAFVHKAELKNSSYYRSLIVSMKKLQPLNILLPNTFCFKSALCHAQTSGKAGYVGHERITPDCKKASFFFGECISYGYDEPIDIVMSLLIDEDIPSLGHRKNLLGNYKSAAVSIQPHTTYRYNTVIDLAY